MYRDPRRSQATATPSQVAAVLRSTALVELGSLPFPEDVTRRDCINVSINVSPNSLYHMDMDILWTTYKNYKSSSKIALF